ncbi:HDOD domain-containing protein [Billgrantia sp. LNSP4103-1]|uniref:HDOD domain-containing protein n=1 Tax=Billgrantia sp. LNSP4103-1 TaxID=3410266 RepID=UPI00403F3936
MIPASLRRSLEGCDQLPSLPQVVLRVIELARDPQVDLRDMVAAIGSDPALSVHLLSLANTVFYVNQHPVEDLQQAVNRLGMERTLSLALGCSLVHTASSQTAAQLNLERYWQRSLVSAMSARLLAERAGLAAESSAIFTAALLQDIGMLGIQSVDSERYLSLMAQAQDHRALAQLEREVYGIDHTCVGEWLAHRWKLSLRTADWIRSSHQSLVMADTDDQKAKNCIVASGLIADAWLQGEAALSELATQLSGFFRLETDEMLSQLIGLQEQLPAVATLYNVRPPEWLDPKRIMHEARMILLERTARLQQDLKQKELELERLRREQKELELKAKLDPLTRLYNRDHLETTLREALEESRRDETPLSVIFVDLDHFKEVNDRFGHEAGDRVLIELAGILRQVMEENGIHVGRYGGDEFVLILPGHDTQEARSLAECLRARFASQNLANDSGLQVTASFGLATLETGTTGQDIESLLRAADRGMYRSKHSGRDRISVI